jgi:hypothetical protein
VRCERIADEPAAETSDSLSLPPGVVNRCAGRRERDGWSGPWASQHAENVREVVRPEWRPAGRQWNLPPYVTGQASEIASIAHDDDPLGGELSQLPGAGFWRLVLPERLETCVGSDAGEHRAEGQIPVRDVEHDRAARRELRHI